MSVKGSYRIDCATDVANEDGRKTEEEELIKTRDNDRKDQAWPEASVFRHFHHPIQFRTYHPGSNGRNRHLCVVGV